jgi:hypothetical protein
METSPGSPNMKKRPNALGSARNGSRRAKHENGTRRPRYCQKRVRKRKTWKRDPSPSVPPTMSLEAQNLKTGPGALGTVENTSASPKHEKRVLTPSVPLKTSPGAKNIKTGPDTLVTAKNESASAKHENWTRHPRYGRKRVRQRKKRKRYPTPSIPLKTSPGAQNIKTVSDALVTVENESGSAKHEN